MTSRAWVGLTLIVAMLVGCTDVSSASPVESLATVSAAPSLVASPTATLPPTPPPTASPEPLPSDLDPDLVDAIRLRRSYGLRSDLAYVRKVAADPRASDEPYGVAMYPEELTDVQDRYAASDKVYWSVQSYGGLHAQEFGGLYIDEGSRAGVVSLWTKDLPIHAAEIRKWVGPDARVAFLPAKYPEFELRRIQDQLVRDWRADWIADIPAVVTGAGVDIQASQAYLEISSAEPDAAAIIAAHYDLGDRLRVESDGTGARLIPWGFVDGLIVGLGDELAHRHLSFAWELSLPGTCGRGDMGIGVGEDGRFELPCQAGERTIVVQGRDADGEHWVEIGRGTVTVPADARVALTIEVSGSIGPSRVRNDGRDERPLG